MDNATRFFIGGQWVEPASGAMLEAFNPATQQPIGIVAMGDATDVDRAVKAARGAFESWSRSSREERTALLDKICEVGKERLGDLAAAITTEMGAPKKLATKAQAPALLGHFGATRDALESFPFEESIGATRIVREPVGVCGLITPWNWPVNQIACKVAPALAAGCTVVLKPSELAPYSAIVFAEILDAAGVPPGVFNLVQGNGPTVGAPLAAHPGLDMISFTGSTRAGIEIARAAAPTVKRVAQELGGKSANVILDDADFDKAVAGGMLAMCNNTGQSCNAPSRMLIPVERMDEAASIASTATERVRIGNPTADETTMGPVVSRGQFERIQKLIARGIEEGARLVCGGPGRPDGIERGWFVRPTVFAHVTNDMTIAREEIFGPVLSLIGYADEDDAVRIANDTPYGLSGYVSSGDPDRARAVARRLRTGNVHINGAPVDFRGPFGGYKQSGNGREWGRFGLEEFLETKAILGYGADAE